MPNYDKVEPEDVRLVYAAVVGRRLQWDSLVWQVPVLSLTAQAFLFGTALGEGSSRFARIVASLLSILITIMSVTLMARHRQAEVTDAHWLERAEMRWPDELRTHGSQWRALRDAETPNSGWTDRIVPLWPGYKTWVVGLSAFGVVSIAVIVATLFWPGVFES